MEIPSYEDLNVLEEEIRDLKILVKKLIEYLEIPKIYTINSQYLNNYPALRGKIYTNKDDAYIVVNKIRQEYFNKHAGMTCMSEPQWITERPDFTKSKDLECKLHR